MKELLEELDAVWSFDDGQQHTHTWHDKQDFLDKWRARLSEQGWDVLRVCDSGFSLSFADPNNRYLGQTFIGETGRWEVRARRLDTTPEEQDGEDVG